MIIVIEMLEKLYFTINCKIIILEIDFSKILLTVLRKKKKNSFHLFHSVLIHFISLSKSMILKNS